MKKYIILLTQLPWPSYVKKQFKETCMIAACDESNNLMIFNSTEEANYYREQEAIDGQIVELPIF